MPRIDGQSGRWVTSRAQHLLERLLLEQWLFQRALMRKGPPMVIECWPCRSWLEFCGPHILDRGGFLVSAAGSLFPLAPVSNPFPVELTYGHS